ncbi:N-acetylmuramoyl-L-alanine amidase [Pedosphaera parvula]|uniref:N-acetylmuramoyl-L-alanine amidase n=1 Tax=Pedosphaera parvula (strain Ellin514) TaxID=320771 RepID=B9XDJ6_PEDPL|nr:N-acetylmuramoyl-L-alanine amidase [Pedosphaera parvula]EEF62142.1 N-acetylmuramyl-L-alanine amidase, negative regulator of AmpC, AmpD [Pedosphaera parvula Ellin514]
MNNIPKSIVLAAGIVAGTTAANASSDYAPAIWNPAYSGHWYTSGNGHKFVVCHDMEGYYLSTISYFQQSGTQASIHYCVNGKQDTGTDAPAGELTQMVSEAYYAWHVLCWNTYCAGTEHEGFASNPAWYTDAMYNTSGLLQRHLCDHYGIPKDRNHIVGHDEWQNAAWCTYASAHFGIDTTCNSHTDPGQYWDWNKLMSIVNPTTTTIVVDNADAGFSTSANWATGTSATDKYGADYRYRSNASLSDAATFSTSLPSAGTWTVYVWYPEGANRSSSTPFIISTSAGDHTEDVNQQITGGQWVNQGSYTMNSGANYIKVSCWTAAAGVVVADAVKWVQ